MAPARNASSRPRAGRAGGVGRARPQRGRAARREHDRGGAERAPVVEPPADATPLDRSGPRSRGGPRAPRSPGPARPARTAGGRSAGRSRRRPRGRPAAPSGRPRVRARGVRGGRRRTARRAAQVLARRAAPRRTAPGPPTRARPRARRRSCPARCRSGLSSCGHRRRQPALRPVARRLRQRRRRDQRHARARAGAHSAVYSPAAPAPTTISWVPISCKAFKEQVRYSRDGPGAAVLEHPSSLEHDTGPHPEQPARIVAIERELAAARLARLRAAQLAGRRPRRADAVHPRATRRR